MHSAIISVLFQFSPAVKRGLYHRIYDYLAARYDHLDWPFMNYGYADLDPFAPPTLRAADEAHRYGIQLYRHVIGDLNLQDRRVLEVSCGRGGGTIYMADTLVPRMVLGVDFSASAIRHCGRRYVRPGLWFAVGDAEHIPCASATFDAVVNIEASHCYGSMLQFLAEVRRVLVPGGHLLFADLRSSQKLEDLRRQIRACDFTIVKEQIITRQVCRALELDNTRKVELIRREVFWPLRPLVRNFARIKGTPGYEALRTGQTAYVCYVLVKPLARDARLVEMTRTLT